MTWAAIPGQSTRTLPVPAEALEKAEQGINALSASISSKILFGFLKPPPLCLSPDHTGQKLCLTVNLPDIWITPGYRSLSGMRSIWWQWGTIWESDSWYEPGWHPDAVFFGLPHRWQHKIRAAMAGELIK